MRSMEYGGGGTQIASSLVLRAYQDTDYPRVRQILQLTHLYDANLDTAANLTRKQVSSPGSIIVAVMNMAVMGVVYTTFDGWKAVISRLAVDPAEWGHGIGTKLLAAAERHLKSQGASRVYLQFEYESSMLADFYSQHGYKPRSTVRVMSKELA